ncbi:MAG: IS21-like element helper ATPase IstB [Firmicutes bacterium]|nr:IS21-like element helper ATPase IstB [Bacillota bacterium]
MLTHSIEDRLHQLGLDAMAAAWRRQQADPACLALAFDDRLGLLADAEWAARRDRQLRRRLTAAHLRLTATPEDWDTHAPRPGRGATRRDLARGAWIPAHPTVLITGPTGVGQTYFAGALGHAACRQNSRVRYDRVARWLGDGVLVKQPGTWTRWLRQLSRWDVLILDDWGGQPFTLEDAHDLLEIIDDRVPTRATVIASQVPWEQWHGLFPDATLADAMVDRLVHQAHRVVLQGESMRKILSTLPQSATTEVTTPGGE